MFGSSKPYASGGEAVKFVQDFQDLYDGAFDLVAQSPLKSERTFEPEP
jgi:hypothetical protein